MAELGNERPGEGGPGRDAAVRAGSVRVSLWGRSDVSRLGDLLHPRIAAAELTRRLPGAHVTPFAPLGEAHPVAMDGGLAPAGLGAWSSRRREALAGASDAVVVGGGELPVDEEPFRRDYGLEAAEAERLGLSSYFVEGLGPELERLVPVLWNAPRLPGELSPRAAERLRQGLAARPYLSVADEGSRRRLVSAGVAGEIAVVPDPLLLAGRLRPAPLHARRLAYLRLMGWWPAEGDALVVQGGAPFVSRAPGVGRALEDACRNRPLSVVIVETEPADGDEAFAEAVASHSGGRVFRVPGTVSFHDLLAALAGARAILASSSSALLVGAAFGVPAARLAPEGPSSSDDDLVPFLVGQAGTDDELRSLLVPLREADRGTGPPPEPAARVDAHFDRLAGEIERAVSARAAGPSLRRAPAAGAEADAVRREETWRSAWEALERRLLEQRFRIADATQAEVARRTAELESALKEISRLGTAHAGAEAEARRLSEQVGSALAALEAARADLDWTRDRTHELEREAARLAEALAAERASRLEAERKLAEGANDAKALAAGLEAERARGADAERALDASRAREASLLDDLQVARALLEAELTEGARLRAELEQTRDERGAARREAIDLQRRAEAEAAARAALEESRDRWERDAREARGLADALQAELATTRTDLETTRDELATTRTDLETTRDELATTRTDLETTRAELATTRTDLETTRAELATTRTDLETTRDELETTRAELEATLARTSAEAAAYRVAVASLEADVSRLTLEREAIRAEFVRFTNLRVIRYTEPLRGVYRKILRWWRARGDGR